MPESPTRLPFSLKVDGEIISDGYGKDQFKGKKLMLELWSDHVDIRELSRAALYNSSAPNIIAGLAEDAPKNIKKYVGRTFLGVVDRNGDARYETVLIFSTRSARQVDAASVLRSFGAHKIMMLDGGGSTQLICQDKPIIASERLIPQALGIKGGVPPQPKSNQVEITTNAEQAAIDPTPLEIAQVQTSVGEVLAMAEVSTDQAQNELQVAITDEQQPAAALSLEAEQATTILPEPAQTIPEEPLIELAGVLWVPTMMAPAMAFVFLIVLKMRLG
jgi:hypothetical protein